MQNSYVNTVNSKGRVYRYFRPTGQRLPDGEAEALAAALALAAAMGLTERASISAKRRETVHEAWAEKMIELHRAARYRATRKDRSFDLTPGALHEMIRQQQYRCAVTGLRFIERRRADRQYWRHPYAPSLDRKDSRAGYTPDNVRLVIAAVNVAMGEWGEEVFLRVAEAALLHRKR